MNNEDAFEIFRPLLAACISTISICYSLDQQLTFFINGYSTMVFISLFAAASSYVWLGYLKEKKLQGFFNQVGWAFACSIIMALSIWLKKQEAYYPYLESGMIVGLAIGFFLPLCIYLVGKQGFQILKPLFDHPQSEELIIMVMGNSLKINLTDKQRAAVWSIFNELTTRIATVKLSESGNDQQQYASGILREALTSINKVFGFAREQLKSMPQSPHNEAPLEVVVNHILNQMLRPFLARWHPRLKEWEDHTDMPEHLWPLNKICRYDLEQTRKNVLITARSIAKNLKLPEETARQILGESGSATRPFQLHPIEDLIKQEASIRPPMSSERIDAGWRIMVECAAFAKRKPPHDGSSFKMRIGELNRLRSVIRIALKKMQPTPPTLKKSLQGVFSEQEDTSGQVNEGPDTVELIALSLLVDLSTNLDNWHHESDDSQWTQLQQSIIKAGNQLGSLLGVRNYNQVF